MFRLNSTQKFIAWTALIAILSLEVNWLYPAVRPFLDMVWGTLLAVCLAILALKFAIWAGWWKLEE